MAYLGQAPLCRPLPVATWIGNPTPVRKSAIANPPNPSNPPLTRSPPCDLVRLLASPRVPPRAVRQVHRQTSQDRNFRSFGQFGASIGASVRYPRRFPCVLQRFLSVAWTLTSLRSLVRVQYRLFLAVSQRRPIDDKARQTQGIPWVCLVE